MQYVASQYVSREKALDYLFQETAEEQLEAFQGIQNKTPRRPAILTRVSQWFRGLKKQQAAHYDEYYTLN